MRNCLIDMPLHFTLGGAGLVGEPKTRDKDNESPQNQEITIHPKLSKCQREGITPPEP